MTATQVHSSVDYSRKWYVMTAVGMGVFLSTIDSSIVNVALPTLVRELKTDFPTVQWVVLAYLLTLTTLMLSVGRLADMRGKKSLYTLGFVVFTVGSVLSGLAPSVYGLIAFRVLQALGATMILSLGNAIITEAFPPEERGRALGINGTIVSLGIIVGPTLGGLLVGSLSWRWIFFVNLPVGILGTILVIRYIPSTPPIGKQRFDVPGAILFMTALLALLLAMTFGQTIGFGSSRVLLLLLIFLLCLVAFIRQELRAEQPLIDLRLFRKRDLTVGVVTGFSTFVAIAGITLLMPFFLENVLGYDPQKVGLLMASVPIAMGIVAPISGSLSDRFGTRPMTVIGLAILLIGYLSLMTLSLNTSALMYLLLFFPIGIGMGAFQSPNNSAIMGSAPPHQLGVVSGMLAITRTLGQTTGIAILGAIWASRVLSYEGSGFQSGATEASAVSQILGLHNTLLVVVILIASSLGIAVWAFARQRSSAVQVPEY